MEDRDSDVREALARRDDLPDELVVPLARRATENHDTDVQRILLRRPALPDEVVQQIARSHDDELSGLAKAHPVYRASRSRRTVRAAIGAAVLGVSVVCLGLLGGGGMALLLLAKKLWKVLT